MTGEEYLRALAATIVADVDEDWWPRFTDAFQALALVDAVNVETATAIGEEIRAGLTARTGNETDRFSLGWTGGAGRRGRFASRPDPDRLRWPPPFSVGAMPGTLPGVTGTGGAWFVTRVWDRCFLVAGGFRGDSVARADI